MQELLIPYIRVGTTYYKIIERPQISGDKITSLVKWSRETSAEIGRASCRERV